VDKSGYAAENRTTLLEAPLGLGRAELESAVLSHQILALSSRWADKLLTKAGAAGGGYRQPKPAPHR
jgi:hypothetical protein